MPKTFAGAAAAAVLALLSACASDGAGTPTVEVLAGDAAGVAPGATYAWKTTDPNITAGLDPRVNPPQLHARTVAAIDKALADKGFRKVASAAEAQLEVAYHIGLMKGVEAARPGPQHTGSTGFGGPGGVNCSESGCISTAWTWGMFGAPQNLMAPTTYTEGALMFDLYDRTTDKLVWQAIYTARVLDQQDGTQKALDAVARELLKGLPGTSSMR